MRTWSCRELRAARDHIGPRGPADHRGRRAGDLSDAALRHLRVQVADRRYRPGPLRTLTVRTGDKTRQLGIPDVRDQILCQAWRTSLAPAIEGAMADVAHGYRRGRDRHTAVARLLVPMNSPDYLVIVDVADLFESLRHHDLLQGVAPLLSSTPLGASPARPTAATRLWVRPTTPGDLWPATTQAPVEDDVRMWLVRRWLATWRPAGRGVPPGASLSADLANLALTHLVDPWLERLLATRRARAVTRYADDISLVTRGDPRPLLGDLRALLARHGLALQPAKTRITPAQGPWPATVLGIPVARTLDGRLHRVA